MDTALLQELEALRAELALLKKPAKVPCPKVTGKGVPCTRYCVSGEGACKMHNKVLAKPEKVPCPKVTGKGVPCTRYCVNGEGACKMHIRVLEKPAKKKVDPRCDPYVPYVANASQWVDEVTFWRRRCETMNC
jgi:hypothetical protein